MYTVSKTLQYNIMQSGTESHVYSIIKEKKNSEPKTKEIFACKGVTKDFPIFHEVKRKGEKITITDGFVLKVVNPLIGLYYVYFNNEGNKFVRRSPESILQLFDCKGKYRKLFLSKF